MMKKLFAAGAGAAMLLATATPVFASVGIFNFAEVLNVIETVAMNGGNTIAAGDDVEGGTINSGDATAVTGVTNVVNSNDVSDWSWDCGCDTVFVENIAVVYNDVVTGAMNGGNTIAAGDDVEGGNITSGDAVAGSVVTNVVNTNMVDTWWPVL